ncbi:MAG: 16S rRNA processing protein RimM [Actinobacteria bacterium]|nr:16S rRNA processing protein RimM [Actinomycetota bacterium]
MTERLLEVGRIGRAHGVRGEVYVDLLTDRTERLAVGSTLRVGERELVVVAARPIGSRWLVQFHGCSDRNAAEALVNSALLAEAYSDKVLSEQAGALYVHQLIGSHVFGRDGQSFGQCVSVLSNPAHDLLELADGSLVPVVFVTSSGNGRIVIDPPPGLFDIRE